MNRLLLVVVTMLFVSLHVVEQARADAVERMRLERLRATHLQVEAFREGRREVELKSDYVDFRSLMHVHSRLSHDSNGTVEEIVEAARAVGAQVVMFTEHPAPHYDFFADGNRGMRDGVLLVPGAETNGFLAFPTRSLQGETTDSPQAFSDLAQKDHGLTFVSHIEERMNWDIIGSTGMEIYNTHADVKDEPRLAAMLGNPIKLAGLAPAVSMYPQETFAAVLDYPTQYLSRYDQLCQLRRVTGVAANDAHQNQGIRAIFVNGTVRIESSAGDKLMTLDPEEVPALGLLVAGKREGDVVFALDLDPYERSFRHVSTHLLMKELSREAVWDALIQGRVYVAFDWMADPTGFVCYAEQQGRRLPLGSETIVGDPIRIRAQAPVQAMMRLVRNGQVIAEHVSHELDVTVNEAGVYRVEALLTLVGEPRPWILANPFYVRERQ